MTTLHRNSVADDGIELMTFEFRKRLAASLEMLCGEPIQVEPLAECLDEEILWREFVLSTVPKTIVFGGAPRLIGAAIGAKVLAAAGLDEMTDEEVAGSYDELLKSAIMAVAQALGRSSGRDVDIEGSHDLESAPHLDGRSDFSLCFSDQVLQPICFGWLSASDEIEDASAKFSDSSDSGRTPCSPAGSPDHNGQPRPATDLERILDLELPLRISFGKATLPLSDVLRLTSGSIVQLNRSIADPVEIIVNDRVVGRGEVVVVEGNYGVRISEIVGGDGHGRF